MSSNPKTEQSKTMDVQTAQRVEQGKMTRRAALRKLGFGAGLAAFSLLSVDDLARMVGQRMERMAGDNKVAGQVAKEFQQAGVAFAYPTSGSGGVCSGTGLPCGDTPPPSGPGPTVECQHCANQLYLDTCYCTDRYDAGGYNPNPTLRQHCDNQATQNYDGCVCCWCAGGVAPNPNNACPPVGSEQPPQGCNC